MDPTTYLQTYLFTPNIFISYAALQRLFPFSNNFSFHLYLPASFPPIIFGPVGRTFEKSSVSLLLMHVCGLTFAGSFRFRAICRTVRVTTFLLKPLTHIFAQTQSNTCYIPTQNYVIWNCSYVLQGCFHSIERTGNVHTLLTLTP